ncbi:NADP-dependent 3-hydroxy acid dehydrogenase YdfG [Vreelandella subterranea]|uniref:NADP-dependent 3-hydroxy acid dehydrogenase YdfG n=1 Tax=Vreelandella subterranea TaxID=416874 RepID=A0A1H9WCV2_9GAMM|nr:SDR family NAD(P)-dependent oxidoreductase [Halomonas subterranea]SES31621.1 NADP-dependent 3-hydroxy acid dehydrogenase YdfG [Halomonas subterranea]
MARNWLITGASRGLGLEIARAALAAGETVVATARSANDVTEALGPNSRLHALALDITDEDAAVAVVQEAADRVGTIDVLVNNAGQAQLGWFETISSAQVRRQFEVNVFGTMNVTRAVVLHMRARQSGLLITISSVNGLLANPGGSIYASSKFAVEGWIEGFAQELAPLNITSMVVEPGMLRTDFLDDKSAEHGDIDVPDYAEATRQFRSFIAAANHNQPGDPVMLAEQIVSLGMSNEPPARFVFGDDAQEWATDKVGRLKMEIEESVNIANGN